MPHFVINTLLYTLLAAALDVVLGATIALLASAQPACRAAMLLDAIATLPLAIPGVVLAVGYLRVFHGWDFPGLGAPLTSSWFILVIAYTMRRLPYTVRACYAALQQVHISLEESAQNLGANRFRTFVKITLPLIGGGLVAGGLIAFVTSCVELSSTIMLVPRIELGPISYGIYLYMQSPLGRGAGAALGVVAIVLVSLGTYLTHRIFGGRAGSAFQSVIMNAAQVSLENIGKRYGELWVVRDVNLHIQAGDFFTFLGPSGCGKTTLLRMIAGFAIPDEGSIRLDDREVSRMPPWQRDIGMVFQNYALWPHLTVFENVAFGLRERKIPRDEVSKRVTEHWKWSTSRAASRAVRHSFPAANSSASLWRALWSSSQGFCCSMSRSAISTPSCASKCGWNC